MRRSCACEEYINSTSIADSNQRSTLYIPPLSQQTHQSSTMGNAFGTIKDELNKAADKAEEVQAINDAMDRLIELAELRLATFKAELAARDNLHIPIDRILYSDFRIDCQVASNSEGLQKAIGDSIGAFVSGKVVEGVTAITNVALNALLGSMSASSARRQVYAIGVGPLGGVYRVDAQFYMYRFESKGLKDNLKYVLSSGIVISSASVTGMKRNEVKNLIQNTYTHATPEVQRGIYQEVWACECFLFDNMGRSDAVWV